MAEELDYDETLAAAFYLDIKEGADVTHLRRVLLQESTRRALDAAVARIAAEAATMGATTDAGTGDAPCPSVSTDATDATRAEASLGPDSAGAMTHNAGVAGSSPAPAIAGQRVTGSAAPSATTVATTRPPRPSFAHPYGGWL